MILVGNDAEFIVTTGKRPVSVIGLIGGSKHKPLPVECGALQEDNVLAEINIIPAVTVEDWQHNITKVMVQLQKKLPKGYKLSKLASAIYPDVQLIHPLAREFGCDPDYNAWTGQENPRPAGQDGLRSAGGHIHVGINGLSEPGKQALIRCMDVVMGLQSVLLDKDTERKKLYGKAGSYRDKPYGVEWRTPSNFWIFNEYTRAWVFFASLFCAENFKSSRLKTFIKQDVVDIIDNNDKRAAKSYLRYLSTEFPSMPLHRKVL